jgi:hypothetical protein
VADKNKTQATSLSVEDYLAAIDGDERGADCRAIAALMTRVTGETTVMWGSGIVGCGAYHYTYDSGREGDAPCTGFASRKGDISIYLTDSGDDQDALLARLGRHKMGKACLYVRKLADIDVSILEKLVAGSVAAIRRRYPAPAAGREGGT